MYSVNSITSVADCDTILTELGKIKTSHEIRKTSLTRQLVTIDEVADSLPAEITAVNNKLIDLLAQPTEGMSVTRLRKRTTTINELENRQRLLARKLINSGPIGYLSKTKSLNTTERMLAESITMIAAVEARKVELNNALAA